MSIGAAMLFARLLISPDMGLRVVESSDGEFRKRWLRTRRTDRELPPIDLVLPLRVGEAALLRDGVACATVRPRGPGDPRFGSFGAFGPIIVAGGGDSKPSARVSGAKPQGSTFRRSVASGLAGCHGARVHELRHTGATRSVLTRHCVCRRLTLTTAPRWQSIGLCLNSCGRCSSCALAKRNVGEF